MEYDCNHCGNNSEYSRNIHCDGNQCIRMYSDIQPDLNGKCKPNCIDKRYYYNLHRRKLCIYGEWRNKLFMEHDCDHCRDNGEYSRNIHCDGN